MHPLFSLPLRITLIVSLFLSSFILPGVSSLPAEAARGFSLSDPQTVQLESDFSEEYRIIIGKLYAELVLSVSDSGEISGQHEFPFQFDLDGDQYSGSASFSARGTYDADNKTVKGVFDYRHQRIKYHTFPSGRVAELNGSRNLEKEPFTGTHEGGEISIQFRSMGTVTYGAGAPQADEEATKEDLTDLPDVVYQPGVDTGARFYSVQGEVQLYPDGDPDNRSFARTNMVIEPGVHIFTGEESSVVITFADMSTYRIPPNSEIVIRNFDSKSQVELLTGKIWENIKKIAANETIEVPTSQAVLGIKGTTFSIEERTRETIVKLLEGSILVTAKASGKSELISAGDAMTIDSRGTLSKTRFDIAQEQAYWDNVGEPSRGSSSMPTLIYVIGAIVLAIIIVAVIVLVVRKRKTPTPATIATPETGVHSDP